MKKYPMVLLTALTMSAWSLPLVAQEQQSDYLLVSEASEQSEQDYDSLKSRLFKRYDTLVEQLTQSEKQYTSMFSGTSLQGADSLPQGYAPWWQQRVAKPLNESVSAMNTDVMTLFLQALQHSSQIKVFSDLPLIRETSIQEADGAFDVNVFAEGALTDLDEPVGDDLKTGGPLRYEETSHELSYGVKKKFVTGTEVELKQTIGDLDTNSVYFNPEDQARSGTYLTISQPLLKRFGIGYNRSGLDLAAIDHSISREELRRNVESHLLEVSRAYWGLYLERALLAQKTKLAEKSAEILKRMEQRTGMDVEPSLLARARSMAGAHKLAAMQAEYALRNAQSRIRALVNDPTLLAANGLEMVTVQRPTNQLMHMEFDDVLQTAISNRPEIAQAIHHIQAASIRLENTANELRPNLDLFFQTYVKGLEGDYKYGTSYDNQFSDGGPSYVAGLRFEYPLGNNSAEARNTRKKIEMRQYLHQLDTTVQNVLLEAQVSYRELIKNYRSMVQSYQIMHSDENEVQSLMDQIDLLLTNNEPYGDVLYRMLDADERLSRSEELYAQNELSYNYSSYNLYRAMGVLVQNNGIDYQQETDADKLPVMRVARVCP